MLCSQSQWEVLFFPLFSCDSCIQESGGKEGLKEREGKVEQVKCRKKSAD